MNRIEKCRYFNDHKTCCILFLDDLSLTYTSIDGTLNPSNDWGYGMMDQDSLFAYLYKNLFDKYPEIRGTVFMPLEKHGAQNRNAGYRVFFREYDEDFITFSGMLSDRFEFAFHGIHHGRYKDPDNPSFSVWENEFEYFNFGDTGAIRQALDSFEKISGIRMRGGKTPGYKNNEFLTGIIKELGFKWWVSSADMMNRKSGGNECSYIGDGCNIVNIPANVSGDIFRKYSLSLDKYRFPVLKYIKTGYSLYKNRAFLSYLYEKGLPITIQEHCQNSRTDGRRQRYNIYDDLNSIDEIYGILRGYDVWHTKCGELAEYFNNYKSIEIKEVDENRFEIINTGSCSEPEISIRHDKNEILNLENNERQHGLYKNGYWVYNGLKPGKYRLI